MSIESCWDLICFVPIETEDFKKIFGFAEFLAALALLAVLYTVTDIRYKFRVAVTPGFIYPATFALIAFIGVATLLTEVWVAQKWYVPKTYWLTPTLWQAILGLLFLGAFLTWTYYAYIRPPVFGHRNSKRYAHELVRYVLRGNDEELRVMVNEVAGSADQLVGYCKPRDKHNSKNLERQWRWNPFFRTAGYANDVLLLLSDRRVCRIIVKSSPITALAFFEAMGKAPHSEFPMSTFGRNLTMEAVAQKDSFLYSEVEGYESGFFGYVKPISQALYGNYSLLEGIQRADGLGIFDVSYSDSSEWDGLQWGAFYRAVLITLRNFLATPSSHHQSQVISSAISEFKTAPIGLEKINDMPEPYESRAYRAFKACCDFATEAVKAINEAKVQPYVYHVRRDIHQRNIYDQLAKLVFHLCVESASVRTPVFTAWMFQHNLAWDSLFNNEKGPAWDVVRSKTRRLMYEEILRMAEMPNYVSARAVGFCLNVMGVRPANRAVKYSRDSYAIARKAQEWARENYLTLERDYPDIAKAVLTGGLSFDKENSTLTKTNAQGLRKAPSQQILKLQPPKPEAGDLA